MEPTVEAGFGDTEVLTGAAGDFALAFTRRR